MPAISANVRYHGNITSSPELTVQEWRRALKETWNAIGFYLFDKFVQKHFTTQGADEYRSQDIAAGAPVYQARSGDDESGKAFWLSYQGRKQKKYGHQIPMVFSDATREAAKAVRIYATFKGVRVALSNLVYMNRYKPQPKKYGPHAGETPLDLRADLLAISRNESETVRKMHKELMETRFGNRIGHFAYQIKD